MADATRKPTFVHPGSERCAGGSGSRLRVRGCVQPRLQEICWRTTGVVAERQVVTTGPELISGRGGADQPQVECCSGRPLPARKPCEDGKKENVVKEAKQYLQADE